MKIKKDCVVVVEYQLLDQAGKVVESSEDEGSIDYLHGHDQIQPELEKALEGTVEGAALQLTLPAGQAFGEYDPEKILVVPRSEFPPDAELVPGDLITVAMGPEDLENAEDLDEEELEELEDGEMQMKIVELRQDAVFLDANHPLAGQPVTFKLKVVSVRPATPQELVDAAAQEQDED